MGGIWEKLKEENIVRIYWMKNFFHNQKVKFKRYPPNNLYLDSKNTNNNDWSERSSWKQNRGRKVRLGGEGRQ